MLVVCNWCTFFPGLMSLSATSAALLAAVITWVAFPVASPLTTIEWASTAAQSSIWQPISLFIGNGKKLVSFFTKFEHDIDNGKYITWWLCHFLSADRLLDEHIWPLMLLTVRAVGKPSFLSFLYILLIHSNMMESIFWQISPTMASGMQ